MNSFEFKEFEVKDIKKFIIPSLKMIFRRPLYSFVPFFIIGYLAAIMFANNVMFTVFGFVFCCLFVMPFVAFELAYSNDYSKIPFNNINYFKNCAETLDLHFESSESAIQPLIIGSSNKALSLSNKLFEAGYGSNPDLAVSVNQVLRKGEFNTLDGIVDLHMWIKAHGMEHSVVPIHYCGEALNEEQQEGIHPLEVKAAYDIMSEIDSCEFNDIWKVYSPFPKNKTCNRPGRGVHIRATGKVTSCSESPLIDDYVFGDIHKDKFIDIIRSSKFDNFKEEFALREGKYICNPDVCDLCANHLCRGGCATRSAYSKFDPETGLIVQNTNMQAYSQGREDPLCPAWTVLAQKQGVLKEGVYENVVEGLLANSGLDSNFASRIKQRIVANFSALRNGI